jgi:RNA polymerase sigma-70 factor (ECF subfamily)
MLHSGEPSDEELLEGYAQGDPEAFDAFFVRHRGRVYQYALRKLARPELAAEVSQEVFLKLHSKIHLYRTNAAALPWFFTIVHNACIDALRKASGKTEVAVDLSDLPHRNEAQILPSITTGVLSPLEEGGFDPAEELSKAVAGLSQEQRAVMQGRLVDEKSFRTLANESGKSEVALRKIYSRALEKLRTLLGSGHKKEGDE